MSDDDVIQPMSQEECWEFLADHEFGRIAYHLAGEVHIAPINYACDDGKLYFRTAEGSKLLGIVMNSDVAFEVDQVSEDSAASVVLRGRAALLEGDEERAVEQLPLRPWVPTLKFNVVSITPEETSGRRFHLSRPWTHLRTDES